MSWLLVLVASTVSVVLADVTIDLSTAELDPETGNFCVVQRVCVANPPSALTGSGCAPVFPPGCNCDPQASPEDSTCPIAETCVQCRCLKQGCDCDPTADNPDSLCPAGDKCIDCQCQSPLAPGCDCDPNAADPDSFCAADLRGGRYCEFLPCAEGLPEDLKGKIPKQRCVGCKCQSCPQSDSNLRGQGSSQIVNPPMVFVIDTTKSVKPDKDSIFNLTSKVTDRIMKDGINIPRYQLVSFNDYGPAINLNVRLELDTDDVVAFAKATRELKFESYNGGRDSKERLAQGLLVALQNASPKSLVVVFTDNGSKDLMLENDIVKLSKAKEIEVFIVLTPAYEGRFNGKSLPAYSRMGKVFLISEVGADSFLRKVEQFEEENCV